ncbi:uncharacterized protein LOC129587430 [Paramacrobiotus metropolitanus]|uniref:uncharacterized protein LOC129587430 n=1 Tax=Paramacrobiotus metropolitanus TaxID=2943436 RepID=UPI00244619AF|nr:uncharacterized protein LOC129587430 [Paramacrobiotus metropolitanus]
MLGLNAYGFHIHFTTSRNFLMIVAFAHLCLTGDEEPMLKPNPLSIKPLATIATLHLVEKVANSSGNSSEVDNTCSPVPVCPQKKENVHYVHGTAFVADQIDYLAIYCQGWGIRFRGNDSDPLVRDRSFHAAVPIPAVRNGEAAFIESVILAYEGYNSVILKIEVWDGDKTMVTYDPLKRPPRKTPGTDIIIDVNQVLTTSMGVSVGVRLSRETSITLKSAGVHYRYQ